MKSLEQLLDRIAINPQVMVGKPVIRGTRVPVELIVKMLARGIPQHEILSEYARLVSEDLRTAFTCASRAFRK